LSRLQGRMIFADLAEGDNIIATEGLVVIDGGKRRVFRPLLRRHAAAEGERCGEGGYFG
jgi:hypothetical protein